MNHQSLEEIRNFLRLSPTLGTAGQPTEEQFAAIKAAGYEMVINLRPYVADALPNEQALVEAQGMGYVHIPVIWGEPTPADLERFFQVMEENAEKRVFVHCAMNMRVSAFVYLYRVLLQNMAPEVAAEDLHRIWIPDGHWKEFVERMTAQSSRP